MKIPESVPMEIREFPDRSAGELEKKVEDWMSARLKERDVLTCAMCEATHWKIGGIVPAQYPMVQIICANCGTVVLVTTEAIGLPST